jgi:hypothetical protein
MLGVQPGASELAMHRWLSRQCAQGTPAATLLEAEAWLLKLDAANRTAGRYPGQSFQEVLAEYWFFTCHSAAGLGSWTWRKFNASPLRRFSRVSWKKRYRLLRLVTRGIFKNHLLRPI